jgi:hypothetical protein
MRLMPATPMADQERDQHRDTDRRAGLGHADTERRVWQQGHRDHQEDDGERHQQDGQGDLVRRLLALGILDHGDHAVDEGLTRVDGDPNHDPVGQHPGAASHGREVAARFADDWGRLAGDGGFVDRSHALDHLTIGGDGVAGLDQDDVALAQIGGGARRPGYVVLGSLEFLGLGLPLQAAQAGGLGLAAALGQGLGEVGEQHREPEPERNGEDEAGRRFALAGQGLEPQRGGQDAADIDHEHDRIAPLNARVELAEGIDDGRFDQRRVEHGQFLV